MTNGAAFQWAGEVDLHSMAEQNVSEDFGRAPLDRTGAGAQGGSIGLVGERKQPRFYGDIR